MIVDFQILPFTLNIRAPFKQKKGLLLFAKKANGETAYSEVSPLPGFSIETLSEAEKQLNSLRKRILNSALDVLQKETFLPSVAFGLDSLFHNLYTPTTHLTSYPLCAFLNGTFEEIQDQIPFLLEAGYQHIKLKVSQLSFENAHKVIESLIGKVVLKIDVNRAWSLKESLSFFSKYPLTAFEYIEEPAQNPKDLLQFPYPIALDETLRENRCLNFLPEVKAFIIKPMLTGNLASIQKMVALSQKMKAEVTLSSSYESGVGLFHLCSLLERAKIPIHPLGVDTHRLIHQDILVKPHIISKGMLTLSHLEVLDVSNMVL